MAFKMAACNIEMVDLYMLGRNLGNDFIILKKLKSYMFF